MQSEKAKRTKRKGRADADFRRLLDYIPAETLDSELEPSEIKNKALARARFANLQRALALRHIDVDTTRAFLRMLLARAKAQRGRKNYTWICTNFEDLITDDDNTRFQGGSVDERYCFKDRRCTTEWDSQMAVSVQSCKGVKHWFKDFVGIHSEVKSLEPFVCDNVVRSFTEDKSVVPSDATLGFPHEAGWFTPIDAKDIDDAVATLLAPPPDQIRDRLGLFDYEQGKFGFVFVLSDKIDRIRCRHSPCAVPRAPTVFDARRHKRFRHWPESDGSPEPNAGRTYDLNENRRKEGLNHGLPELVIEPFPLRECVAMYRMREPFQTTPDKSAVAYIDYAEAISKGRRLGDIIETIIEEIAPA